jgi:hypothetical protein
MLITINAIGSGAGLTLLNNLGEEVSPLKLFIIFHHLHSHHRILPRFSPSLLI